MSRRPWTEIKRIFDDALELPSDEQSSFVAAACEAREDVRSEVESLLRSHGAQPEGFLEVPAVGAPRATETPGRIDVYRVIDEIGHGGMGRVFLATRDDGEFDQRVAIKLIRGGIASDVLLRRFRIERRILSILEHPSITRLLDAGTTADGVPYLVMEYVAGEPIDRYCDRHRLSLRDRLELFASICDAVTYAHRKLIVHRDLKPQNVLVTEDGQPKLLDFGIAKLLHEDGRGGLMTATDVQLLTPRYASPEQLRGEAISTASDIYSLGVLLYELLAGAHPFDRGSRSSLELMHAILQNEPRPLSVAAAARPGTSADRRALRGDLDVITMNALRREPEARYASVADLAGDIRRYLEGRPISARKPTALYRAQKFVRRNKAGVAATFIACAALVASTVISTRHAIVAQRERARAEEQEQLARAQYRDLRDVSASFMFELIDILEPLPGSLESRQLLAARALRQLDGLRRSGSEDPDLLADVAAAYERVGRGVADIRETERIRRLAVELNERLVREHPGNRRYREQLASSSAWLGNVLKLKGDHQGELAEYARAVAVTRHLVDERPADLDARGQLRDSLLYLGRAHANHGSLESAVDSQEEGVRIALSLAEVSPSPDNAHGVVTSLHMLATTLVGIGRGDEALGRYRVALPIARGLVAHHPNNNMYRRDVWLVESGLGHIHTLRKEWSEALAFLRSALLIKQRLYEADPADRGHQRGLAISYLSLGHAYAGAGDVTSAIAAYRRSIAVGNALLLLDPDVEETYVDVRDEYRALRTLLVKHDRPGDAETLMRREAALYQQILQEDPANRKAAAALAQLRHER